MKDFHLPRKVQREIEFIEEPRRKHYEVEDGITFSMNQKGGMLLIYQGYSYTKKSRSGSSQYWRCIHQKALDCKAGVSQILGSNKFKISCAEHNHPIITTRRKPGEYKALIKAQSKRLIVVEPNVAKIRTYDGKPLKISSDLEILKQLKSGHALCHLRRKRVRGYCVKCIKKLGHSIDYKKILEKIFTYCPACEGGPWFCGGLVGHKVEYTMSIKGKLLLMVDSFSFVKQQQKNNNIYWVCKERNTIKCKAKVIQDAKTNKLRARILTHTHQPITVRRKAGELMALRKKHGFKSKIESRKNKSSGNDSK